MPITAATAEYALRIPQNSTLMNPPSLTTDAGGHPFIATYWAPHGTKVPQFHLVHHDGQRWSVAQITRRTQPFELRGTSTKRPPVSRAVLLTRQSPNKSTTVQLIYRDDERGGKILTVACDDLRTPEWKARELTSESVGAWEPSIDPVQWTRSGQVHLLIQAVQQQDGNDGRPAGVPPSPVSLLIWTP